MSRIYIFIALLALISCSDKESDIYLNQEDTPGQEVVTNPNNPLTENKKWTVSKIPSSELSQGIIQGAAIYNGIMYQFRNGNNDSVKQITYDLYDIKNGTWTKGGKSIRCVPECHAGSACFCPDIVKSYTLDNKTFTCTLPFVFFTGHYSVSIDGKTAKYEVIDVIDMENDNVVRRYTFPNKSDDVIAAYDFANNKVWIIGYYREIVGMSAYIFDEYDVDLNSLNPEKTNFFNNEIKKSYTVGGPGTLGYQEDTANGTLQDACYYNGYIYLAAGRGSSYNRTEWSKVHTYDTYSHKIVSTMVSTDATESEGFICDGKDFYMTTGGKNLWKLTDKSGYDNKYNFEPATEVATDSFTISNGSQLVWFMSQVFNGRSYIKGTLTADIDMSQVEDPYTFYVYDTNITDESSSGRKFEAYYAFRGSFDGQGHTISNFKISQTPYYNDGLFPYVVGATIKNLTVKGNIKLTKANHSTTDAYDIQNVGFIGYMDGGTLDNIDVSEVTIDISGVTTLANVSSLVGAEKNNVQKTNIK